MHIAKAKPSRVECKSEEEEQKKKEKKCEWNCLHLHNGIRLAIRTHMLNVCSATEWDVDDGLRFMQARTFTKPSLQEHKNTTAILLHSVYPIRNEYL